MQHLLPFFNLLDQLDALIKLGQIARDGDTLSRTRLGQARSGRFARFGIAGRDVDFGAVGDVASCDLGISIGRGSNQVLREEQQGEDLEE